MKKQTQAGFIPFFIIAIIVLLLGGVTIYNLQKNNQQTNTENYTANKIPTVGGIKPGGNSAGLEQLNPEIPVTNTTSKKSTTTTSKPVVSPKTPVYRGDDDDYGSDD